MRLLRIVLALSALLTLPLHAAPSATPAPVTSQPWKEAVISVYDLEQTAAFFTEIGQFETVWRGNVSREELAFYGLPETARAEALLLEQAGFASGQIRLIRFESAGRQEPMRPGGHAWDSGCYFSLMIRMKNIDQIYDEAIRSGWWTETPITPLEFGTSKLKVVIFKGPQGIQVQGYERLSPPLPEGIPPFDRMSAPFNMMQMVSNRDRAYAFFTEKLGFATFYYGKPYRSAKPEPMPIGIPENITDSSAYSAAITYPVAGEFGRMEMIETIDLKGYNFSDRCHAPNFGILAVRFPVVNVNDTQGLLLDRGVDIAATGVIDVNLSTPRKAIVIRTPDGARVEFFEQN
jgi:catechol 2,3-dioxygenase-like lactoylglutathione lyase family enzyme